MPRRQCQTCPCEMFVTENSNKTECYECQRKRHSAISKAKAKEAKRQRWLTELTTEELTAELNARSNAKEV
jgi:hypothetical protein